MLVSFPTSELPTTLQTVEEFEQWERQHPHEGNYEFVRGRILPRMGISQDKFALVDFISRRFIATEAFRSGNDLIPRIDTVSAAPVLPDLTFALPDLFA